MKIQFSKLSGLCQAISILSFGALVSSCQLPKEKDDRYSVAEWSVNSTVAKEDYPVGVSLEQIEEATLPSPEEIANGLLDYQGQGRGLEALDPNRQASPSEEELVAEPQLASLGSEHPVSDELLSVDGELHLPPLIDAQETEVRPVQEEIRTATINRTPENLALMAASTTRPPMAPRGVNGKQALNFVQAYATPSDQVASVQPDAITPLTEDLTEILKLARQVEASRR